ncbi:discoidin domain-containing protein [Nonomuraea sp. NEAU-L178]|nr:discoidin domain-containing protein [Nonomuraea aurantiaca]
MLKRFITAVGLASLLPPLLPAAAQAAAPVAWVQNSADHVFSTSTPPAHPATAISLYAARGEYEAAQVLYRPPSEADGVSLSPTALAGPGGATIPVSEITVRRQYNHPNVVMHGRNIWLKEYEIPPAGGTSFYDALVDNTPILVPANYAQAYHYSVHIPTGQPAGVYTGSVTVESSAGDVPIPVSVRVYPVTVPPADQSTFKQNNWFASVGWDYKGAELSIPEQYADAAAYSPNWWKVIAAFARNQAKHRNNVIYTDFQALLIPDTTIDTAGNYTFGWATFDRFVKLFEDAGAMQYIYTPTLLEPHPVQGASRPMLEMLKRGSDGKPQKVLADPNTAETTAYLNKLFPALKAHLDAKGWTDQFYMSALDEPTEQAQVTAATWFYDIYTAYFPDPLTNEAHGYTFLPGAAENITTFTPYTDNYEDHTGYWQDQRLKGKELWLYVCIVPWDYQVNRLIGMHLAKSRLMPWLVWKIGGKGFQHWGWNYWAYEPDGDFRDYDTFDGPQNGDSYIVRPDKARYDVYDSVRSEAQLDGVEDYELLNLLAATKPVTARAIADTVITDIATFERSGQAVTERHKQILDALAPAEAEPRFPYADDFSDTSSARQWLVPINRASGQQESSWSISGGEFVQPQAGTGWDKAVVNLKGRAYRDVAASVDLRITGVSPAGGQENWAGLMIRNLSGTEMDTGYLVAQRNNGEVFIVRSGTILAKANVPGYVAGQRSRLRVVARGDTITVYAGANAAPLLTVTDKAYQAGDIALITGGAAARFDNFKVNPETNPAEGRAITASSSYEGDGWSPQGAVDGERGSVAGRMGWSSHSDLTTDHRESITVDLGSAKPVSRVDLYPRADAGNVGRSFPVDFTVQVSANKSTWTTVATRTGFATPGAGAQTFPFPTTDVRYVKVEGTKLSRDPYGHYRMQFAEIEVAGGNLAAGRAVSTSTSYEGDGWSRTALTDGQTRSALGYSMGWSSHGASTANATVDLAGPTRFSSVVLRPRTDGEAVGAGFPVDYTIQVSADNATWTTVATRTGQARPGISGETLSFAPVTARYVRMAATRLSADPVGDQRLQLAELEVR